MGEVALTQEGLGPCKSETFSLSIFNREVHFLSEMKCCVILKVHPKGRTRNNVFDTSIISDGQCDFDSKGLSNVSHFLPKFSNVQERPLGVTL